MPTQNPHRIVGLCTSSKVYNTLTELKQLEGHRSAKMLSLLAQHLVHQGLLSGFWVGIPVVLVFIASCGLRSCRCMALLYAAFAAV